MSRFLFDPECSLYKRYRSKVESLRKGVIAESTSRKEDADTSKKSKRKSRWGDETDKVVLVAPPGILPTANAGRNPQLVQYAIKVFGSTDLEEAQWKQCEDQLKVLSYLKFLVIFLSDDKHPCTWTVQFGTEMKKTKWPYTCSDASF